MHAETCTGTCTMPSKTERATARKTMARFDLRRMGAEWRRRESNPARPTGIRSTTRRPASLRTAIRAIRAAQPAHEPAQSRGAR